TFGSSFTSVAIEPVQPTPSDNANECKNVCWLIFTCINSRAIHLEYAKPGDSASVVQAINRFFKMWNVPKEILFYAKHSFQEESDNGRNRLANILPMLQAVHKFNLIINPPAPLWNKFYPILIFTLSF